jgi:1-acyl-sn-glycerol-3-phosphate acyltransferase
MIYGMLRWMAGVALHWFYGDIRVEGAEKIPSNAPLLIAVNHMNALVDSLIIGWLMPRRVVMTAKATLLDNAFLGVLFRALGVVPLRRAIDERQQRQGEVPSPARNSRAFREMLDVLRRKGAVLIFPEGTSHSNSSLVPLKSGLARVALQARDNEISDVQIVPIGLVFENKATPGSVVGVRVGDPIKVDDWPRESDHAQLTAELSIRLRALCDPDRIPAQASRQSLRLGRIRKAAIVFAAAWGRVIHELPIRLARRIAVRVSTDPDQPAMFTIVIGLGLVLATYTIYVAIVGALTHSVWIALGFLALLLPGAYWAAFEPHLRR